MYSEDGIFRENAGLGMVSQLVQSYTDSSQGFHEVAADIDDRALARYFRKLAIEKSNDAEQLRECLSRQVDDLPSEENWLDGWRRIWLSVRAALNISAWGEMIQELDRAETRVIGIIDSLLARTTDPSLMKVLGQHRIQVCHTMETLRALHSDLTRASGPPAAGRHGALPGETSAVLAASLPAELT